MQSKYKKILILIGLLIIVSISVGVAYLFYDKVISDNTEVVVEEELSINFNNGYIISNDGEYSFSITNSGDKDTYYEITYVELSGYNPNITYSLSGAESNINITNRKFEQDNNTLADNIIIKAKETQNFNLKITNLASSNFKIKIKKLIDNEEYFNTTILKNNKLNKDTATKIGEEIATTNEGLIEDTDDYGLTYYYRGAVTNNYVKFADLMWRIVRINGDGTVKLVLDEALADLSRYNENITEFEKLSATDITKSLEAFYALNLKNYDNYIVSTKYCTENLKNEIKNEYIYSPYTRLITNNIPSFNCLGDSYSNKIGLITADEVAYAGANFKDDNKDFYLYNIKIKDSWWTSSIAKSNTASFYPFSVTIDGKIVSDVAGNTYHNARPTINLIRKVAVTGKGTATEPYEIITS